MKPRFQHDCDRCVFLGSDEVYDFYFCRGNEKKPVEHTATVIARFGSDGPEYGSGLEIALALEHKKPDHSLVKALKLSRDRGFMPTPASRSE